MVSKINISFQLKLEKTNKDGYAPLYLILTKNYERVAKICDHVKIKPKLVAKSLETTKESIRYEVKSTIEKMIEKGIDVTPKGVMFHLSNGFKVQSHQISQVLNEYVSIIESRVTKKTVQRHINHINLFITVCGDLDISSYTRSHIEQFKNHITSIYQTETCLGIWKKTKAIFRYASDCGYTNTNPFNNINIKQERKEVTYLDRESIDKLIKAKMPNKSLQNIVDCAVFQIASGLAYCDLCELGPNDINTIDNVNYIKKPRRKTGSDFVSYVLPFGMDIWRKHKGQLPIKSNQKYNAYLKVVGDLLGIEQNLHTHLFRHTYATLLLNSGVPIHIVQKALGHTNVLMTQHYYAHLEDLTVLTTIKNTLENENN